MNGHQHPPTPEVVRTVKVRAEMKERVEMKERARTTVEMKERARTTLEKRRDIISGAAAAENDDESTKCPHTAKGYPTITTKSEYSRSSAKY